MGDFIYEETNQPLKHPVEKIPNKYQECLMYSKMRNQKLQELNKQHSKNNKFVRLEEGFSLYFNGANSELSDKKEKSTAIAPRKSKTSEERGKTYQRRSKSGMDRPTWGSATKLGFLTERGDKLFVRPPNYYSEDFDEVEEGRNEFENSEDDKEFKEEETDEPWDNIEEEVETNNISVDLSLKDVKCLRQSLVLNNRNADYKYENDLPNIAEDENEEKIMRLQLKIDNDSMVDVGESNCDNRLREIIDRVLKMNLDQQEKLLNTLQKIEKDFGNDSNCDEIEIRLIIVENWGHPLRIGLTEIEFWDCNKQPIKIVRVTSPIIEMEGQLENLTNQKKDTSKEKNMWSTSVRHNELIQINFLLQTQSIDDVKFLAVWNFNKSFDTLSMGVKKLRVENCGRIVCEGSIDKALGNSAFNPPTILEMRFDKKRSQNITNSLADLSSDDECLMDKFQNTINARKSNSGQAVIPDLTFRTGIKIDEMIEESLIEENTNRKGSARFGRRSEMDLVEGRDRLKEIVAEFENVSIDKSKPETLEKSWSSLMFFNKSHAGRLSLDHTGDILDQYVDQIRRDSDVRTDVDEEFVIPELPRGRELRLNILSTWGDPHYVGLTGIEMFASTGERAPVQTITADPCDINILPGYGSDPRVVKNLLDGINKTRDDVHMWLAPFTPGRNHFVIIRFIDEIQLALLRIWNYNKSRIHSSRGARDVEITLDGTLIFKGEISRTSNSNDIQDVGEVILFTSDDLILDRIGLNDQEFVDCHNIDDDIDHSKYTDRANELLASLTMRPPTAKETISSEIMMKSNKDQKTKIDHSNRPFTSVRPAQPISEIKNTFHIKLSFTETWGDKYYIGLTGMEFVLSDGTVLVVNSNNVSTNMDTLTDDMRVVTNIFDGNNITTDDSHMWLAPFCDDKENVVMVHVEAVSRIVAMRVWNYNKSLDDSYRGVKTINMWVNEKRVSPDDGYFLRRAPGHIQYNFVQEINLIENLKPVEYLNQYQHLPCGFIYQINISSAWNDVFYVGLNGIELFDHLGRVIDLKSQQVYAYPDSVNSLTPKNQLNHSNLDVRTPDKLVDGINDTYDPKHMWLAPILPGCLNKIFVVFDHPVALSMIKFWNYSKSPSRGVKDFTILVDDLLIHSGTLPAATSGSITRGILPNMKDTIAVSNGHKTVLFDKQNIALLQSEKFNIIEHCQDRNSQDVILINDNDINTSKCANQKFRPTTSVKGRSKIA